jgi:hypothetical protein
LSEALKTYLLLTVIIIILIFKYFFNVSTKHHKKQIAYPLYFQLIDNSKTDSGSGLRELLYRARKEYTKYLAKHLRTNLRLIKKL